MDHPWAPFICFTVRESLCMCMMYGNRIGIENTPFCSVKPEGSERWCLWSRSRDLLCANSANSDLRLLIAACHCSEKTSPTRRHFSPCMIFESVTGDLQPMGLQACLSRKQNLTPAFFSYWTSTTHTVPQPLQPQQPQALAINDRVQQAHARRTYGRAPAKTLAITR